MSVPVWFTILWGLAAAAYAALCCFTVRTRSLRLWPSLFALALDEVLSFCVLNWKMPYSRFFWISWINTGITAILQIWIAYDVLRSIPAYQLVSLRWRQIYLFCAAILGAIVFKYAGAVPGQGVLGYILMLNRSASYAWGAILFACLIGILYTGLGFTTTGLHITIGMLVRLASSMAAALIYSSSTSRTVKSTMNAIDTGISLAVAVYWCLAMRDSPRARAELREDINQFQQYFQPPENEGN